MKYILVILATMCAWSCGDSPKDDNSDKDRPETQKLKAADAAGYDGDALKHTVDKMLDKRDQQKKDLEDAQNNPTGNEEGK